MRYSIWNGKLVPYDGTILPLFGWFASIQEAQTALDKLLS